MMLLFLISAAVTVFLLVATVILMLGSNQAVDARLMEIATPHTVAAPGLTGAEENGLAQVASGITGFLKPVRDLVSGTDADLAYRLLLAGFRKPEHIEIFTAIKMLLPVLGVAAGTF